MATNFNMKIIGLDKLLNNAKKAGDDYPRLAKQAMVASATIVQNEARKIGPDSFKNRTGNLRRRIQKIVYSAAKAMIYTDVPYAPFVEQGTGIYIGHTKFKAKIPDVGWRWVKGQKAKPFMEPAFKNSIAKVQKIFNDLNARVVKGIAQ